MESIRAESSDWFQIEVAAFPEFYPQAISARDDLTNFKHKLDARANAAFTQHFYNADAYFNFVDECEALGITIPIMPGIMPIGNFSQLTRFFIACGLDMVTSLYELVAERRRTGNAFLYAIRGIRPA